MRVVIVGAGPAGLFFARLLKRSQPDADVRVYEQSSEGATWGFGVGLGGSVLGEIASLDSYVHDNMAAAMFFAKEQCIILEGQQLTFEYGQTTGAISRLKLLQILADACQRAGVILNFESKVVALDELPTADLIVAADGVNSRLREAQAAAFGTKRSLLTNRFAWYGVAKRLYPSGLVFRRYMGGTFVGHYYAFDDCFSTFVAECDAATWHRFGLETMTDDERRHLIERVFVAELGGAKLISNHSVWRRFPVTTNRRYASGNLVLLGDCLQSAHFSIGSGTRLAMEDAAALHQAVDGCGNDIMRALRLFEKSRRPKREQFGAAARRSFEWYEAIATHMEQPLIPFVHDFLTRTGRITDERLQSYAPGFDETWRAYRGVS